MRSNRAYYLLWLILIVLGYFLIPWLYPLEAAWRALAALNAAAFILFALDKLQAQSSGRRVPERLLYLASFAGGSIGALVAMQLFRHKTRKVAFQLVLALLILIQIVVALWWTGML